MSIHGAAATASTVVVAVDVGKATGALSVTDASRHRLLGPVDFAMTGPALVGVLARVRAVLPSAEAVVKVGVEAAGHYHRPLVAPSAWSAHRTRRVETRTAMKNQLLGQLDRSFPGLTLALPDVLGTKVGRLVAEHFADPKRLAALGATRFIRFADTRGLRVRRPVADRLVHAAPQCPADA